MLGFHLDLWDYIIFFVILLGVAAFLSALVFILELPGKIAIARNHPDAEAVRLMGLFGFMALVPWIQAFIWAFKPTAVEVKIATAQQQQAVAAFGQVALKALEKVEVALNNE